MTAVPHQSDSPDGAKPAPRSLWRNRDYVGWWVGETVSDFGSSLSVVAYPLLMLLVTGSAARAGIVGSAVSVGSLATLLLGGALADRYPRRVLLIAGPLVEAVAVGTVALAVATGHVNVWHVSAVGFMQGLVGGLASGASRPAMRRIVPAEQLPSAYAQLQGRGMAVRLAGPPTGGFLFSIARWVPFGVDALSFVASAVGVAMIRRPLGPDLDNDQPREPIIASIRRGLRFVRHNAYLRYITVWSAVMNMSLTGLMLLIIVLIRHRGGSPTLVGAVSSIGAAGGLVGALVSARIVRRFRGRTVVLVLSWISVAVIVGIALVPAPWQVGLLLATLLVLISPMNVIFSTYETRMIPDALSARVSNAIDFGSSLLRVLGPLLGGIAAAAFGPQVALLLFAVPVAAVSVSAHIATGLHALNKPIDEIVAEEPVEVSLP